MRGTAACMIAAAWLAGCAAYPVDPSASAETALPPPSATSMQPVEAGPMLAQPATAPPMAAAVAAQSTPVNPPSLHPAPDRALLVVYRSGLTPYRRAVTIYVNGTSAAELDDGYYTVIQLPPGHAHVESSWSLDLTLLNAPGFADVDVQAGTTYYFRVTNGATWLGVIGMVPVAVGLEASAPTPAGATVIGAGLVLLAVDEVQARRTGRALAPRSDEDATRDMRRCSYVAAEAGFMPAQAPAAGQ